MSTVDELIKKETEFCEEWELPKNEHGQFIFTSIDGSCQLNLPRILNDYKDWLIENGIVKPNN